MRSRLCQWTSRLDAAIPMASQIPGNSLSVAEVQSYIRGYHAYVDVWTPSIGETLLLRREPDNLKDKSAVAVVNNG